MPLHSILRIANQSIWRKSKSSVYFLVNHQLKCYMTSAVTDSIGLFGKHNVFDKFNILLSSSHNIYSNLALEDWIYENVNFDDRSLLLLWRNEPCVVIGRHQNPWAEANVHALLESGCSLARRRSGGGAVFHDLGNLNCTFFTSRAAYNRKENVLMLVKAIRNGWGLDVSATERDDIWLNGKYKISGSSSKLGRKVAYHHCTLLFDANTKHVSHFLSSPLKDIQTRATASVRSSVRNLCEVDNSVSYATLIEAITTEYSQRYGGARNGAPLQTINPEQESVFPGVGQLSQQLVDWEWIYGKTPSFTVRRNYSSVIREVAMTLCIEISVENGRIKKLDLQLEPPLIELSELVQALIGQRFWLTDIAVAMMLCSQAAKMDELEQWIYLSIERILL